MQKVLYTIEYLYFGNKRTELQYMKADAVSEQDAKEYFDEVTRPYRRWVKFVQARCTGVPRYHYEVSFMAGAEQGEDMWETLT